MIYKKSQLGWLLIAFVSATLLFLFLAYLGQWGDNPIPLVPFLLLAALFVVIYLLFYKLTIEIRGSELRIIYGIGIIKIVLKIDELISVEEIITPWWYGLGIRITPKGMLYNIQGLKAVRLEYVSKGNVKSVMVGTAEPEKLARVLKESFGLKT
jgi:hypothetical protein